MKGLGIGVLIEALRAYAGITFSIDKHLTNGIPFDTLLDSKRRMKLKSIDDTLSISFTLGQHSAIFEWSPSWWVQSRGLKKVSVRTSSSGFLQTANHIFFDTDC